MQPAPRVPWGERHHFGRRKLDAAIQAEIRRVKVAEGLTNRVLAPRFVTSVDVIGRVIRGTY